MRRPVLSTLIVLGALICLIGGTGLFAALTDTARTGTNSVDSGALAASADIQLATATYSPPVNCGTFSDDLATGFFTASDVAPNYNSQVEYFCIRNVGSQSVNLSALVDELTDVDFDCTGDEAIYDPSCGSDQLGELSSVMWPQYRIIDCTTSEPIVQELSLYDNVSTPVDLGSLGVGDSGCFSAQLSYPPSSNELVQAAQSDQATWRFMFAAQA